MNYKLLAVSTGSEINIGDYIQALASAQFLPTLDGFVQREEVKDYDEDEDEVKIIMNGWFMHHPEKWPPAKKIHPLFVAFHVNSTAMQRMLTHESISYLKNHEPIGCRDIGTMLILKENNIDAFFSGCMTLTLGEKYKASYREDTCYFVDPYFITNWNFINIIRNSICLIFNWKEISFISNKHPEKKTGLRKKMILATFYREYKKIFSRETLLNAEYINQQGEQIKNIHKTEYDYLHDAEILIKKYACAKLVVTSRIHCALPCLGLETPVIYIDDKNQSEASACRLNGLKDLLTLIVWNKDHLESQFKIEGKISIENHPNNNTKYKILVKNLVQKCKSFILNDY